MRTDCRLGIQSTVELNGFWETGIVQVICFNKIRFAGAFGVYEGAVFFCTRQQAHCGAECFSLKKSPFVQMPAQLYVLLGLLWRCTPNEFVNNKLNTGEGTQDTLVSHQHLVARFSLCVPLGAISFVNGYYNNVKSRNTENKPITAGIPSKLNEVIKKCSDISLS